MKKAMRPFINDVIETFFFMGEKATLMVFMLACKHLVLQPGTLIKCSRTFCRMFLKSWMLLRNYNFKKTFVKSRVCGKSSMSLTHDFDPDLRNVTSGVILRITNVCSAVRCLGLQDA